MQTWKEVVLGVTSSLGVLLLLGFFITYYLRLKGIKSRKFFSGKIQKQDPGGKLFAYGRTFSGMNGLDLAALEGIEMAAKWRSMFPVKPFDWSDYPPLLADAVDRGWAAFAFTHSCTSHCPVSSAGAFFLCTKCCLGEAYQPEIGWEIGPGADFMQLIRLNPRIAGASQLRIAEDGGNRGGVLVQALQSALPLPGPIHEAASFPQEGYFEITIVAVGTVLTSEVSTSMETDNVKLILQPSPSEKYPLTFGNGFHRDLAANSTKRIIQARIQAKLMGGGGGGGSQDRKTSRVNATSDLPEGSLDEKQRSLAVGLSPGVAPPFRFPGTDQGSVALHSDGHILLSGVIQQVDDGETNKNPRLKNRSGWASVTNTTVGCGYSPRSRRVFFTLNGELVGELSCENCKSVKELSYPLHATVAANFDVTLLVNFGQCSFEFMPANDHRVADPTSKPVSRHEQSGDLFSIRRFESQWWSGRRTASLSQPETDADLFEIPLDVSR